MSFIDRKIHLLNQQNPGSVETQNTGEDCGRPSLDMMDVKLKYSRVQQEQIEIKEERSQSPQEILQVKSNKVVHSPVNSHVSQKNKPNSVARKAIQNHYDAWGGQGLDALLSQAKQTKEGSMQDLHHKLLKKREAKHTSKKLKQDCDMSVTDERQTIHPVTIHKPLADSTFCADTKPRQSKLELMKSKSHEYEKVGSKRTNIQTTQEWEPLDQMQFKLKKSKIQQDKEQFIKMQQEGTNK